MFLSLPNLYPKDRYMTLESKNAKIYKVFYLKYKSNLSQFNFFLQFL